MSINQLVAQYEQAIISSKVFIAALMQVDRNLVQYTDHPETWDDLAERTAAAIRARQPY